MKIALFVDSFPKLSETFILSQIDGLLARGHEVAIFPAAASGEPLSHPVVQRRKLLQKTHFPIQRARGLRARAVRLLRIAGLRLSQPRSVGALKATYQGPRSGSGWRSALAKAEPAIRNGGRFDILFAHFGPNGLRAHWYREAGLIEGPLVTVFHGYDLTEFLNDHHAQIYAPLCRNRERDLFMPISRFWESKLREMGCPADKIRVQHVGIDCEQFHYQPRVLKQGLPVRLISVARLVEKKGIEYAIHAFARALGAGADLHYRIIGEGPLLASLENLVVELQLEAHISFVGTRTSDEVAAELQRAHVFVAPSVTGQSGDMEGIPTVLMEAMATGMPVISTRHSGIPELVEDNVSGRLVDERDIEGLADAIQGLASDTAQWGAMGRAGREKVLQEFNAAHLNTALEACFVALAG